MNSNTSIVLIEQNIIVKIIIIKFNSNTSIVLIELPGTAWYIFYGQIQIHLLFLLNYAAKGQAYEESLFKYIYCSY